MQHGTVIKFNTICWVGTCLRGSIEQRTSEIYSGVHLRGTERRGGNWNQCTAFLGGENPHLCTASQGLLSTPLGCESYVRLSIWNYSKSAGVIAQLKVSYNYQGQISQTRLPKQMMCSRYVLPWSRFSAQRSPGEKLWPNETAWEHLMNFMILRNSLPVCQDVLANETEIQSKTQ